MKPIHISSFYKFHKYDATTFASIEKAISALGDELGLRGLFILGVEGINSTFSVPLSAATSAKQKIAELLCITDLEFKDSFADNHPFHDLKVKVRAEIVTLARPDLQPEGKDASHLSPEEWQRTIENEDVVVIDTRNSYEYDIGHFKGAVDPKTREFTEFPEWVSKSGIDKSKKILMYCTGGIRCEKASLEMRERGYKNVFQLDGGIISYLEKFPRRNFDGECFVFDYRVAVDQDLAPSVAYKLCPHCGQPAKEQIKCIQCGTDAIVCDVCLAKSEDLKSCTKNCAHHFRMGHRSRKVHQDGLRARERKNQIPVATKASS